MIDKSDRQKWSTKVIDKSDRIYPESLESVLADFYPARLKDLHAAQVLKRIKKQYFKNNLNNFFQESERL